MLKKICWCIVLSPSYSTAEGSSSDRLTLLTTTFQVGDGRRRRVGWGMKSTLSADNHFTCERRGMGGMGLLWPLLPPRSSMLALPPVLPFVLPLLMQNHKLSQCTWSLRSTPYTSLFISRPLPLPLYTG